MLKPQQYQLKQPHFTQQVLKLLPDITIAEYQKILDMKAVKRVDQLQLIDLFKHTASAAAVSGLIEPTTGEEETQGAETVVATSGTTDDAETSAVPTETTTATSSTPKRAFIFSVGSFTGSADKNADGSSQTGIRKLENLLKKRFP